MSSLSLSKSIEAGNQSKFCRRMIRALMRYKPPKLINGCYIEIDLIEGGFFGEKAIGQLVGKSGERKDEFFSLTRVKPHIEDSKERPLLILSKYNFREVKLAGLLGQRFKASKSWSSSSINRHFHQLVKQLNASEEDIGFKALEQFDPENSDNSLKGIVGKMSNEAYSETQTLLEHSIEIAEEVFKAAQELNLNSKQAQKVAFYHDIGKVFLPYYSHSSEEAFSFLQELQDEEVKQCISTHHNSLSSFTSPNIALTALINRIIPQTHFLFNYQNYSKCKEWKNFLIAELKTFLAAQISEYKDFFFYLLSSEYHFWIVINKTTQITKEALLERLTPEITELIKEHIVNYAIQLDEEEKTKLGLTVYWLPSEGDVASTTRLTLIKQKSSESQNGFI